uniref:Secreted protein n=1 Tax=Ixodes ricinus TaxID=34613 RepID=A0A6B0UIA1_IXORI
MQFRALSKSIDLFILLRMGAAILESRDEAAIRLLQLAAPLSPPRLGGCVVFASFVAFHRAFLPYFGNCSPIRLDDVILRPCLLVVYWSGCLLCCDHWGL